ncbi:MAG: shikimate kinase [Acidimicrobiales bacterium]
MAEPGGRVEPAGSGGTVEPAGSGGTAQPAAPAERVLLVGMMGAGKTSVGRALGQRLGWSYLDSDEEVRRRTGRTVPQLFAERGEAAFRAEESTVLAEACSSRRPVVVSVAGGAVLAEANRRLIAASGLVVWLRASLATLAQRVGDGRTRPLLGADPGAALARLYPERARLYEALAEVVVDVDGVPVERLVDAIAAAVGERAPAGRRP